MQKDKLWLGEGGSLQNPMKKTQPKKNPMNFTPATKMPVLPIEVRFHYNAYPCRIDVMRSSIHSEDSTIKASIVAAGYDVEENLGFSYSSYSILGGDTKDLAKLENEIKEAYGISPKPID